MAFKIDSPAVLAKRIKYKQIWEQQNLPMKSFPFLVRDLILAGYEEEYIVYYDKTRAYYRVDYAHPKYKHIVEFDGKHHTTKLGIQRVAGRTRRLESAGWTVSRIPYNEYLLSL